MSKNPLQLPYRIILGSQSPRRQSLLKGLDLEFDILVKSIEEDFDAAMPFADIPVYLAQKKAEAFLPELNASADILVITADTIVAIEGKVLNKPSDREEALEMLRFLSGKKHTVVTGVCLKTAEKEKSFASQTDVYFKQLSEQEIAYYVDNYKPYDKAGSYGVQEWMGYICIERIEGSYFNVMGLPLHDLYSALQDF